MSQLVRTKILFPSHQSTSHESLIYTTLILSYLVTGKHIAHAKNTDLLSKQISVLVIYIEKSGASKYDAPPPSFFISNFSFLIVFSPLQKGTVPSLVHDSYEERPGNQAPAHFTVHTTDVIKLRATVCRPRESSIAQSMF